jgi:hypothetical protein
LSAEIAGVSANATHRNAQRIETLAQCAKEYTSVELGEIGLKQEFYSFISPRQKARGNNYDEQKDEQRGHQQLGSPLNASTNAMNDDEMTN